MYQIQIPIANMPLTLIITDCAEFAIAPMGEVNVIEAESDSEYRAGFFPDGIVIWWKEGRWEYDYNTLYCPLYDTPLAKWLGQQNLPNPFEGD